MATSLVLLPGLLCDRAVWRSQIDALGPAFVANYGVLDSLLSLIHI